jgi:hypothetical protein
MMADQITASSGGIYDPAGLFRFVTITTSVSTVQAVIENDQRTGCTVWTLRRYSPAL